MSRRLAHADRYDLATAALLAALAVLVLATFGDYAISNDEEAQHRYGELILRYYLSGFTDESAFEFRNLYLYGGLFDVLAVLASAVLPFEMHHIRHVMCGLCGIAGVAATAMTARLIAGPRAGTLAAAVLAVFGLWYGGMFNHTKDIPFAAAMMAAAYVLLRAARDLPRPQLLHVVLFGLFLGLALGQRVTGLLMVGYLALAVLLALPDAEMRSLPGRMRHGGESLIAVTPALLIGYLVMIAAWPWASLHPLNPLRAILVFAQFHYEIKSILAGEIYFMHTVPRWYVPAYVLIKVPLIMLIGAGLAVAFAAARWRTRTAETGAAQRHALVLLAVMVLFPLALQMIMAGPAFTGMRHFLFVVPPLAVLAAFGLDAALSALAARWRIASAVAALPIAAFLAWDAATLVRLHPHQYLAYNALVGGIQGATGRFDTDYWANIIPEASDELQAYLDRAEEDAYWPSQSSYAVAVCGERMPFEKEKGPHMQWTPDWERADFFIAPTHMRCDEVLRGEVIARIERLGVTIGVIKDLRPYRRSTVVSGPGAGEAPRQRGPQ